MGETPANRSGSRQFHNCMTTQVRAAMPATASRPNLMQREAQPDLSVEHFIMVIPCSRLFVVKGPQAVAQVEDRLSLPAQQSVQGHAAGGRHFLEAAPFQLVGDEGVARP